MNLSNKKEKPLISFLVTAYNLPVEMLRQCLESISAVDLSADQREVILVDDGSDESPVNALGSLLQGIIYIRQRNQGLSVARNTALQIARGEYIQFVDGDDYLIPDAYNHCLGIINQQYPDILIFGRKRDEKTPQAKTIDHAACTGNHYLLHHNLRAAAWGYIFHRNILGELRFTPNMLHEDEEFTPLLFLRAESVIETSCQPYLYRQRDQSITTDEDKAHTERRLSDMEDIISRLHTMADRMPKADRDALNRRVAQLSMACLYETARLTGSQSRLSQAIRRLKALGLFPLPAKNYNKKYSYFRMLTRTKIGQQMLILIARHHKEE